MTEDVELRARELLSEHLSRLGVSITGTAERDIVSAMLTKALTISQEQLEEAAKSVARANGIDPEGRDYFGEPLWVSWKSTARAAFTSAGMKCA